MHGDVVTVGLLEDPPVLEAAVEGLMARPHCRLHPKIRCWVAVVVGALDLVGVPHVAVVGLNTFAWQDGVHKGVHKTLIPSHVPVGYGPSTQTRFPPRMLIPIL